LIRQLTACHSSKVLAQQHLRANVSFTTSVSTAARPLVCRFGPLAALLLLVAKSPLRRRALPATRLASPSGAPNSRIKVQ
jgi:hypothetical protein